MSKMTHSERLFEKFCKTNGVPCLRVPGEAVRTPDFIVTLKSTQVVCEVKQIDPNDKDLRELAELAKSRSSCRYLPKRLRAELKRVSPQLKSASTQGSPTLLVIYDNTPFKSYTDHDSVVQAMFGCHSIHVPVRTDTSLPSKIPAPFFGGDRGLGPNWNTAVSAIAILDGGPTPPLQLRVYHNPYAAVQLDPRLFGSLPVKQPILPDTTEVTL